MTTTNQLKNYTELELLKIYKSNKENALLTNKVYSIFYNKYYRFLLSESNRLYNKIDKIYFSIDMSDCENESAKCLKLAMDWFDECKFKGDKSKFSLSSYIKLQMDAKITSYYWKKNKKQKRNPDQVYNCDLSYLIDQRESQFSQIESNILLSQLDSKLTDKEKKLKNYLMSGVKEYKIKNILGITTKEYFSLKENLKQTMLSIGYTL